MNFRLTSSIATVTSPLVRNTIASLKLRKGVSEAIRAAMTKYAHQAKTLRVPQEYQPPKDYADRVFVLAIVPPVLRDEYEAYAKQYDIPMSELVLRCLSAWLRHQTTTPNKTQ